MLLARSEETLRLLAETPLFRFGAPMAPDAVAQAGTIVVPGSPNKLGASLTRVTPRLVARKGAAWLNTS